MYRVIDIGGGKTLLDTRIKNSTSARKHAITDWEAVNITELNARQKKRFNKHKDAVSAYFTTDVPIEEIAKQHTISDTSLLAMAEKCLMRHGDGRLWGFRALLPTSNVIDHAPEPLISASSQEAVAPHETAECQTLYDEELDEITMKRPSLVLAEALKPSTSLSLPETPRPTFDDYDDVKPVAVEETSIEALHSDLAAGPSTTPAIAIPTLLSYTQPAVVQVEAVPRILIPTALSYAFPVSSQPEATPPIALPTLLSYAQSVSQQREVVPLVEHNGGEEIIALETTKNEVIETVPVQIAVDTAVLAPMLAIELVVQEENTSPYKLHTGKTGPQRRIVRKRRLHDMLMQTKQRRSLYQILSVALVVIVLLGVLVPLGAGLATYSVYNNVRGVALDGVNHLLNVKTLLPVSKSDPTAALDAKKLRQAQNEFRLAEDDFLQLQDLTNRADVLSTLQEFSPDYANKLLMARHLVQVALDVSKMGQEVSGVAVMSAGLIHSSPLANATGVTKPLVSVADIAAIDGVLIHAQYYINDIRTQMSQVRMKDVPISDKQKTQLMSLLGQLPKAQELLAQGQDMVGLVSWLLGVGQQRRFLVQTLDRAELRPSGGFTGQYGVLQLQDGRMAPFGLRDVALLDYAGNGVELGRQAPPAYNSWMNFGNWGLRDSNLSGDYPTTARMSMQVFQDEGGGPVDGDISFTPTFIGHILDVTGPIHVAEYNETITSKNLEERLHYYQQDYSAIAVEHQKSNDSSHAARKAFTSLVGKMLLDRVRHLPTSQLLNIIKGAVKDIQSRDLEIYFTNTQAEQWLLDHGYAGATDSFAKQDGFAVVQANISISKASQYVHTTEHDDVVLDAQGGATHNLTITLDYQQTGPVYGFDTYANYIRVYAPQNAQLLSGNGFDTGQVLCNPDPTPTSTAPVTGAPPKGAGAVPTGCSQYNNYFPSDARNCPNGDYQLGARGFQQAWTVNALGAPTNQTSDLPGHTMWGGLTETPKNCISYISLSWYVPHVVTNIVGQAPYTLMVQKQGGYVPSVELTVDASALKLKNQKPFSFKGGLTGDRAFALSARK